MRVVFTIYYNLDEDLFVIYDDSYNTRTIFISGTYNYVINSYLVYFIIYVSYYDFSKVYIGSDLDYTKYLISYDYKKVMDKRIKKSIKIKRFVKKELINVILRLLYKMGYSPE